MGGLIFPVCHLKGTPALLNAMTDACEQNNFPGSKYVIFKNERHVMHNDKMSVGQKLKDVQGAFTLHVTSASATTLVSVMTFPLMFTTICTSNEFQLI